METQEPFELNTPLEEEQKRAWRRREIAVVILAAVVTPVALREYGLITAAIEIAQNGINFPSLIGMH